MRAIRNHQTLIGSRLAACPDQCLGYHSRVFISHKTDITVIVGCKADINVVKVEGSNPFAPKERERQ